MLKITLYLRINKIIIMHVEVITLWATERVGADCRRTVPSRRQQNIWSFLYSRI